MSESIAEILTQFGQDLVDSMRDSMIAAGVDEGSNLVASVDYSVKFFGAEYVFTLTMDSYGRFVDEGRKPTRIGAGSRGKTLQQRLSGANGWIARRGIPVPLTVQMKRKTKDGFKTYTKKFKSRAEANTSLSWAISKKIHKQGYRPKPFVKRGLDSAIIEQVKEKLAEAYVRQVIVEIKE